MELNLNSLTTDSKGRLSFSGLGSKIDFKGAVDAIIAAKRIPADRLETRITANTDKITAYQEFRGLLNGLRDSLKNLYGAVSVDRSKNIFEVKQAFAASSRADGGAASPPAQILGVTVTNRATAGSHSIEVLQTAAAHRLGSGSFGGVTADLGSARGLAANSISGAIEIAGRRIDVLATDTLRDLADRINNANTGGSATGVSASIVQVSANQHYLVLTAAETGRTIGADIALADPDGVLERLGVLKPGGGFANELQAARKAQFHADGVLDPARYASAAQAGKTAPLDLAGAISFTDAGGNAIGAIAYDAAMSLEGLRDAINADPALASAGIAAGIVESAGGFRLKIEGTAAFAMSDSGGASGALGIARQPLLIERSSNTVTDLFDGVTLNFYQAEPGTTVRMDIERDLSQVKGAIEGFVNAYNEVKTFLNGQLDTDPSTGKAYEDATLFGSRALVDVEAKLAQIVGGGTAGVDRAASVLAQIGITFVDNKSLDDPKLADTLRIDAEKLDEALLSRTDDVRRLFTFDFAASDPRVTLLAFDGNARHDPGGYTLDVTFDAATGKLASAAVNGEAARVDGKRIVVESGSAKGLTLFYNGDSDASGIRLDFTVGIGAQAFFAVERALDPKEGVVETEIQLLTTQNENAQTRIDEMLVRIEIQRENLLARFINMEATIASMNRVLESVTQMTDAMFAKK